MIVARLQLRIALTALLFVWQTLAHAVPQIHWGDMLVESQNKEIRESLEIDLRQRWEATVVGSVTQSDEIPLDPSQIWDWPGQRFSMGSNTAPLALQANQRLIARMTVFSERLASDFSITVMMPRLDTVHVSYRDNNGPWKSLSSGDRIAMERWPLADRQPSFQLPLPPGQLDVVMQFAHRGILDAPVLLQNNRAFFGIANGEHLDIRDLHRHQFGDGSDGYLDGAEFPEIWFSSGHDYEFDHGIGFDF